MITTLCLNNRRAGDVRRSRYKIEDLGDRREAGTWKGCL